MAEQVSFIAHARRLGRILFRPSSLLPLIAVAVMAPLAVYAEWQNNEIYRKSRRVEVQDDLAVTRARLEGLIASNLQLVQGLVPAIASEPELGQERFSAIARHLFTQPNQLRSVAASPDLVVEMTYPLEDNREAIGLDYGAQPDQRAAALRAVEERTMVLAGPLDLVQGGRAFVARVPLFLIDAAGRERLWGLVSAVIDMQALYQASGLSRMAEQSGLDLAITGKDGNGAHGPPFFGEPAVLGADPVSAEIFLPNGTWRIWAAPQAGWDATAPNAWVLRLIMGLASALVLVPLVLAARLHEERNRRLCYQKRRESDLVRVSRRLELALNASRMGVWEINLTTGAFTWDARMFEIYGLSEGDGCAYQQWQDALHPEDFERASNEFGRTSGREKSYNSTFRIVTPDGEVRHLRALGALYQDMGASPRIIGVTWDATSDALLSEALLKAKTHAESKNAELEAAKARIEHNALHDSLTGLPNRRFLDQVLEHEAGAALRRGKTAALFHIDLDHFKQINDTLGHAAGDTMLVHVAEVLKSSVRESDFVARVGGDEFVMLSPDAGSNAELQSVAERIIAQLSKPVSYKGHACVSGASIGIARATSERDAGQILMNADVALYRAKREGRGRYAFYSDQLKAEIKTSRRLGEELLCALESEEIVAFYQPQFDARTLEVIGVEALARWRHPNRGLLMPNQFLPVAEELGVTKALDARVFEQTLADRATWREHGVDMPHIGVNISARRLRDDGLIRAIDALDPNTHCYGFELAEADCHEAQDDVARFALAQIREAGIALEINDFGADHGAINALIALEPDRIKLGRATMAGVTAAPKQRRLVESIIATARSLDIAVLATGIETQEELAIVREMGCAGLQGYALSAPIAAEELVGVARQHAKLMAS